MCGFIGRLNSADNPTSPNPPLGAGVKSLRRRGPDSCHYWRSKDNRVELIQARLAIVDGDSRADQPFSDPVTQITVAFNGEIYNYNELRRELSDYTFRTDSDTEVLLATYSLWGLEGLRRLRGMFSCSIIDERKKKVVLVRDPIGKKPLNYAIWPGGVWFGSSLLPLAATSAIFPEIDSSVIAHFYHRGYIPPNQSLLHGARPLAPGEVVELDWDGVESARTDCVPIVTQDILATREAARERVIELLDQSLRRRMHNNPRPVSLLSGGIDSTVVASRMHSLTKGETISLGSLARVDLDEKYARYAAWREGMPLKVVRVQAGRLADEVNWAMDLQDEPLGMISFFVLALLLREARKYGKILLSGDGGDEVFMGYGQPSHWNNPTNGAAEFSAIDQSITVGVSAPNWMSPWARFTVGHSLLGHMFTKLDRASAEQGVEVRCPLLDWDLLAFVRSLPPDWVFYDGRAKGILKSLLRDWPGWFVNRNKIGFAYHIRWAWGMRRYAGLREMVHPDVVEVFNEYLPSSLRKPPLQWRTWDIFRKFQSVWKLIVWSGLERRLAAARVAAQSRVDPFEISYSLIQPV